MKPLPLYLKVNVNLKSHKLALILAVQHIVRDRFILIDFFLDMRVSQRYVGGLKQ